MFPSLLEIVLLGGCLGGVALVRGQRLLLGWVAIAAFGIASLLFASRGGLGSPAAYAALGLLVVGLQMGALRRGGRGIAVAAAGAAMLAALSFLARG